MPRTPFSRMVKKLTRHDNSIEVSRQACAYSRFARQRFAAIFRLGTESHSALKSASFGVGQIASDLLHPLLCRVAAHAGQCDAPGLQLHHEQDIVRRGSAPCEHLSGEEIHACQFAMRVAMKSVWSETS
jgi:hypothetical protein